MPLLLPLSLLHLDAEEFFSAETKICNERLGRSEVELSEGGGGGREGKIKTVWLFTRYFQDGPAEKRSFPRVIKSFNGIFYALELKPAMISLPPLSACREGAPFRDGQTIICAINVLKTHTTLLIIDLLYCNKVGNDIPSNKDGCKNPEKDSNSLENTYFKKHIPRI